MPVKCLKLNTWHIVSPMEAFVSAAAQILLQTTCKFRLFIEGSLKHAAVPSGCEIALSVH